MSETAGTRPEHFTKGSVWIRAYLTDMAGLGYMEQDLRGAAKISFQMITVTSLGAVWATIEYGQKHRCKERETQRRLSLQGYRATKAEAVAALLRRVVAHKESAERALDAARKAWTLVENWKET